MGGLTENIGWKIVALVSGFGFTAAMGFSIRTRAYQAALFGDWCRQVIPNEPLLHRLRIVARLQEWSVITWFVSTVMTANGCFRDR